MCIGVLPGGMFVKVSDLIVSGGVSCQCGCWELNPDPPEEQHVPLITEPSLQSPDNTTSAAEWMVGYKAEKAHGTELKAAV